MKCRHREKFTASTQRLTLGQALVPGSDRDCVSTDACQDQPVTETVCCTGGIDRTSGSREVGCVPETCRALENFHHTISPHTCTPEHNRYTTVNENDLRT